MVSRKSNSFIYLLHRKFLSGNCAARNAPKTPWNLDNFSLISYFVYKVALYMLQLFSKGIYNCSAMMQLIYLTEFLLHLMPFLNDTFFCLLNIHSQLMKPG